MGPAEISDPPDWRRRARRFVQERLAPISAEIDRADRVPSDMMARLGAEGFTGLGIPPEWGGSGGNTESTAAVLEELAVANAAVATDLSVHLSVCAAPILRWGTDAQRARFLRPLAQGRYLGAFGLTEPGVGSDAAHLATRYERVPAGFRLRGSKMFITNGATAAVVLAFATRDPALGSRGISAFLIPQGTPGYSVAQRLDKMGIRGSETTELVFDGAQLSDDALLGAEGEGLSIALGALAGGRIGIAACALGVARAAFEEMCRSTRLRTMEEDRACVARAYVELESARALVEAAARTKDAGRPFEIAASAAKLAASKAAVSIASVGLDIAGPEGTRVGHPAERLLRDARVFPIVEGTTEIQERLLGRLLIEHGGPLAERTP
ncbi:MAG: acyl-CoA dehydrogenase family protein [Thermoplasmata archaeon]